MSSRKHLAEWPTSSVTRPVQELLLKAPQKLYEGQEQPILGRVWNSWNFQRLLLGNQILILKTTQLSLKNMTLHDPDPAYDVLENSISRTLKNGTKGTQWELLKMNFSC